MSATGIFMAVRLFAKRIPWWAYAALAFAVVWYWDRDNYGDRRADEARIEANENCAAKEKARQAALAAKDKRNREITKRTDRNVIASREAVRPTVERFIDAGGVRPTRTPSDKPEDRSAGSGEAMREATDIHAAEQVQTVAVLVDDVRICADNTILAEELRAFVLDLEHPER